MEQAQMILELWRMVRRRFAIIAAVGLLGVAATVFVAYILPPVFEAEAKILVESQQIPDELARSTVTASAAERLQLIEQRLMTRDNLFALIEENGLYANRPDLTVAEKIDRLRDATEIEPIALTGQRGRRSDTAISAFTIKVAYDLPEKTAQIVNEFVTTVLEQNLRARSERAAETLSFFTKEEERLTKALAAIESRITEYKGEHEAALPESLEFRRAEISRLAENDLEIDRRILELEEERGALETALSQTALAPASEPSPEERELRRLQSQIAQKRTVYAEGHREVRALKAQIAAVEATLPRTASISGDAPNGAQAMREAALQRQISLVETQITLLKDNKVATAERRAALEASIERTPEVEMALNGLDRRHSELQDQYELIVRKRAEAATGEKLEINQQAERFEVIENALVPEKPVSPNRTKIAALGSAASLALAFGLAMLVELMRPAIRSAAQMERQLQLRPVVMIPAIQTKAERRRRIARLFLVTLIVVVGVPALLYGVDQYVMPMELIGAKLAEKSGLDELIRVIEARL